MLRRTALMLLVVVMLLVVAPVSAAEKVSALPEIRPTTSARFDSVIAINKLVLSYAKGEYAGDRLHAVAVDAITGDVVEVVMIGNRLYERRNRAPRWTVTVITDAPSGIVGPAAPAAVEPEIFSVGEAMVGTVTTTQYQIPLPVPEEDAMAGLETVVADLFVGKNDAFLHKTQISLRGTDPDLGRIEIEQLSVDRDFNQPISITEPPASLVDPAPPAVTAARVQYAGGRMLPAWARLVVGDRLQQMRGLR